MDRRVGTAQLAATHGGWGGPSVGRRRIDEELVGRVAEVEVLLWRAARRLGTRKRRGQTEVRKDGQDDARVGQEGENPQATGAASTAKDVDSVNTPEELGPRQTSRASGQLVRGRVDTVGR